MKHSDSPSPLWSLIALFLVASIPTAVFYKEGRSPGSTNAAPPYARCDFDQNGNFLPVSNEPCEGLLYRPYYDEAGKPNPVDPSPPRRRERRRAPKGRRGGR